MPFYRLLKLLKEGKRMYILKNFTQLYQVRISTEEKIRCIFDDN